VRTILFSILVAGFLFLVPAISPKCCATVVMFDDLSETATGSFVPDGYEGLSWSNFSCFNAILATNRSEVGVVGYYYGMVSISNVAYNAFSDPAEIAAAGSNVNFVGRLPHRRME